MKKEKKKKILICVLCVVAAVCVAGGLFAKLRTKKIRPKDTVSIKSISAVNIDEITLTAHRGLSAIEPENTLPAFKAACEAKYNYVEFDIEPTSDGKWIVMHDDDLRRTTNGHGKITERTLAEVSALKIDNGANIENYTDLRVPTFEETMALLDRYYPNTKPMIEIKSIGKDNLDSLIEFFKDYAARGRSTIVISFDKDIIDTLYKECPEQTYWLLTSELSDEAVDFCKNHGNMRAAFNGNNAKNTDSVINAAIDAGIPLAAWTVDSPDTLKNLYDLGVRYFTTNWQRRKYF